MKALVADDERAMRLYLRRLLEANSYEVLDAADGDGALGLLAERGADVLVADLRMPGPTGEELIRRARGGMPALGVVIITAYPSDSAVVGCMRAGAVRFLIKPFRSEEFLRAVSSAMDEAAEPGAGESINVRSDFRGWVELTAPSRESYLERLETFVDLLYGTELTQEEKDDLKIAMSEIVSNAVEWGNRNEVQRAVRVSYCMFPTEIVFKIEDEGAGFDPEAVPDPSADPIAHILGRAAEGKRVGGYGLYITRKIMDKVIYNEQGNAVIMSKLLR